MLTCSKDGNKGTWQIVQTIGPTPDRRYGHTLSYKNSTIFLFGGTTISELKNDTWILRIDKTPFEWQEIKCKGDLPIERVYHNSCMWSVDSDGLILIFGGRGKDQNSRNDLWTLYKRSEDHWEWVMANSNGKEVSAPRFQVY